MKMQLPSGSPNASCWLPSRAYRIALALPSDYASVVKSVVPAKPDRLVELLTELLRRRVDAEFVEGDGEGIETVCRPHIPAVAADATKFVTDLLADSDYCVLVISQRSAMPLKRFLASLGAARRCCNLRHRLLFVSAGELEGLAGLDLEAASAHEPIVFDCGDGYGDDLQLEANWLGQSDSWELLFSLLDAEPSSESEDADGWGASAAASGRVRRAVDEFETLGVNSPDQTGQSFSDDSLSGVSVVRLTSDFEAARRSRIRHRQRHQRRRSPDALVAAAAAAAVSAVPATLTLNTKDSSFADSGVCSATTNVASISCSSDQTDSNLLVKRGSPPPPPPKPLRRPSPARPLPSPRLEAAGDGNILVSSLSSSTLSSPPPPVLLVAMRDLARTLYDRALALFTIRRAALRPPRRRLLLAATVTLPPICLLLLLSMARRRRSAPLPFATATATATAWAASALRCFK